MTAIDTLTNTVIATVPIGQAPQAIAYVPNAVPEGAGTDNLQPLGVAGQTAHLTLRATGTTVAAGVHAPTSVSLFDQGLVQVLEASVTGLEPKHPYVLALSTQADGSGILQPLSTFITNPAGSAIVNAIGPIRQIVQAEVGEERRYLVILNGTAAKTDDGPVQIQVD